MLETRTIEPDNHASGVFVTAVLPDRFESKILNSVARIVS